MASSCLSLVRPAPPVFHFQNYPTTSLLLRKSSSFVMNHPILISTSCCSSSTTSYYYHSNTNFTTSSSSFSPQVTPIRTTLLHLSVSTILFFLLADSARARVQLHNLKLNGDYSENMEDHATGNSDIVDNLEDMELKAALESWKSKTFALTVPLRIVALRGSVPPSWIKDFVDSQGRRLKLRFELRGTLLNIFSDMSSSITKGNLEAKSAMAADIVTVGNSWLSSSIKQGIIEPIRDVELQDWFKGLSEKWKVHLRRNANGELDPAGEVWAAPYRWGSMVIAYKKNKFHKHNMAAIEDWSDLWRPELTEKISMVDSPREVIGVVLKFMGASYNTMNVDSQVSGGMEAVMQNFMLLQKQVRLFDSVQYLKAFAVGDVWVAVGWSSDVIPAAKRMSDVAVIVPKSGASLWADLWAVPATHRFDTTRIGGRVRGPSPLIHQWMEFCLLAARALPFKQEVVAGASPIALEDQSEGSEELTKGRPQLKTNLIAGVPPPEILAKCEFLEPLPESALKDYQRLIAGTQRPGHGLLYSMQSFISSMAYNFGLRIFSR